MLRIRLASFSIKTEKVLRYFFRRQVNCLLNSSTSFFMVNLKSYFDPLLNLKVVSLGMLYLKLHMLYCSTSIFTCIMPAICNLTIFLFLSIYLQMFLHKYHRFLPFLLAIRLLRNSFYSFWN